jgi:hypothetical protein
MSEFALDKFKSKPAGHIMRGGKRIEVEILEPKKASKKRKRFKVHHIQMPAYWMDQLEQCQCGKTYHLANRILREVHIQNHAYRAGPIVLSKYMTGLARFARHRAIKDLLRLKLIAIEQRGSQAPVVTKLLLGDAGKIDLVGSG